MTLTDPEKYFCRRLNAVRGYDAAMAAWYRDSADRNEHLNKAYCQVIDFDTPRRVFAIAARVALFRSHVFLGFHRYVEDDERLTKQPEPVPAPPAPKGR